MEQLERLLRNLSTRRSRLLAEMVKFSSYTTDEKLQELACVQAAITAVREELEGQKRVVGRA